MEELQKEIERLTQEIATHKAEKDNLVGELKEDRTKRQEMNSKIDELQKALTEATQKAATAGTQPDVAEVVNAVLNDRDASRAKSNKVAALERFVNEHKEFHDDNDPTGKKREALETTLSRFNTEGLTEVDDFYSVIGDAARLLGANTAPQAGGEKTQENPYSSTPKQSLTPKVTDDSDLDARELKLIEQNGWTKERYVKLKEKMPAYVQSLLSYVTH